MVALVGCNIPLSPLHSLGNTLTAGWFTIDNSSDMRQTPTRFYYLRIHYPEFCFTPRIFQEFRGTRQRKILHTHLRAAVGHPVTCGLRKQLAIYWRKVRKNLHTLPTYPH